MIPCLVAPKEPYFIHSVEGSSHDFEDRCSEIFHNFFGRFGLSQFFTVPYFLISILWPGFYTILRISKSEALLENVA